MLAAVMGAVFGSFLNVVAYRLPRGESLSRPRSRCPGCETPIRPYDNVPVLSWLALRGRCRSCRIRISARYPLVEAGTGLLCALVVLANGRDEDALLGLVLVLLLVPVTLIDLDHRIIPNRLMLIGRSPRRRSSRSATRRARSSTDRGCRRPAGSSSSRCSPIPAGWGWGTSSSRSSSGCSWAAVGPALFVALVAGTFVGAAVIARKGAAEGRKTAVPFGPFLALGAVVALFAGDAMVEWYLSTFA